MTRISRLSALSSMTAALAMTITPIAASAAELPSAPTSQARTAPMPMPGVFETEEKAEHHRRWRGYRGYRHRHRGIDAGDVFAGVLILGGIAAVASAANKNKRDRDYRERDYRYRDRDRNYRDRDYDYRPRRGDSRYDGGRGIDNAVSMCVEQIERDVRVDRVDSVDRTGEGWRVTGSLYNGEGFTCRIGSDGRIEDIDYGASLSSANFSEAFRDGDTAPAAGQWSDDRYAAARRTTDTSVPARTVEPEELPSYPGGPLPGDSSAGEDDRYRTADAPDFTG